MATCPDSPAGVSGCRVPPVIKAVNLRQRESDSRPDITRLSKKEIIFLRALVAYVSILVERERF